MIAFINDTEEFDRQVRPIVRRAPAEEVLSAFIASLVLPGSGHIMRRHYFIGLLFLAAAIIAWLPPVNVVWPIVAVHLAAAFNCLGYGRR